MQAWIPDSIANHTLQHASLLETFHFSKENMLFQSGLRGPQVMGNTATRNLQPARGLVEEQVMLSTEELIQRAQAAASCTYRQAWYTKSENAPTSGLLEQPLGLCGTQSLLPM